MKRLLPFLVLNLLFFISLNAQIVDTWTGATNTDWETASNWSYLFKPSGKITTSTSSTTVTGHNGGADGTLFSTELSNGQKIYDKDGNLIGTIAVITNDFTLTLESNSGVTLGDKEFRAEGQAVPTSADDVEIPAGLSNYPTITSGVAAVAKKVTLKVGGGDQPTLIVDSGGSLTTDDGDFKIEAGTVTVDGGTISLQKNGIVDKNFEVKGNGALVINSGSFECKDFKVKESATATMNGGTVTVTNDLKIEDAGASLTMSDGTITVGHDLEVKGQLYLSGGIIDVENDVKGDGFLTMTNGLLQIDHDYKPNTPSNFSYTGGTVEFTGNAGGGFEKEGTYTFFNVQIDAAVTTGPNFNKKSGTIISIQCNLTIQTGGMADFADTANTAKSLNLGTTQKPVGVYNMANEPGYFETTGTLTVSTAGVSIGIAAVAEGSECQGAGPNANTDYIIWLANNGGATAINSCSDVIWSNNASTQSWTGTCTQTIEITFTATDNYGTATTSATFTIVDTTDPTWDVAPSDMLTVECDPATNAAAFTAWLASFSGSDTCGTAAVTNDSEGLSDLCGGTGTETVTFTLTDLCGNDITADATFTIVDTTVPTAYCKPATVELDEFGVAFITVDDIDDGSFDSCGSVSLALDNDTFSCEDVGKVNTVTLFVTDACGNLSSCQAEVTVNGSIPTVNITQSELPEFCQGGVLLLTANHENAVGFSWTNQLEIEFATTQIAEVSDNGIYTVTVTFASGCTATADYEVTGFDAGALLSSYTLLATDEIHLHGNNIVGSGGVGVTEEGKATVKLHESSQVVDFVQSSEIEIKDGSTVGTEILTPATAAIPDFVYNDKSTKDSPDVKVAKNTSETLPLEVYGKVEIEEGATVTFTASNIYIDEIKTNKDVTIEFEGCARMYVNKSFKLDKNCTFNSTGKTVIIFVDDKVEVKEGSSVTARIQTNEEDIHVIGKDDAPTTMIGMFIGKKIHGEKFVTWNMDDFCEPCEIPEPDAEYKESSAKVPEINVKDAPIENELFDLFEVNAWPNPSKELFNVNLKSKNVEDKVDLFIYDGVGKLILYKECEATESYQFGDRLPAGVYIIKVIQANRTEFKRLIKD